MPQASALPFVITRSREEASGPEVIAVREELHGLLRVEGTSLVVQWRLSRERQRVGREGAGQREQEPVREVAIPLAALANARVQRTGRWWSKKQTALVLTASDLRAFEPLAGTGGPTPEHPGELLVPIRDEDQEAARSFTTELEMALAEHTLRALDADVDRTAPPA